MFFLDIKDMDLMEDRCIFHVKEKLKTISGRLSYKTS